MVVAPATANTLAKMAAGMADNLLTAIYLAFRGPVIVAPTMNWAMNEHAATQREPPRARGARGGGAAHRRGRARLRRRGLGPHGLAGGDPARRAPRAGARPRPARSPARRSWSPPAARASASTPCASSATAPAARWAAPSPTRRTCAAPGSRWSPRSRRTAPPTKSSASRAPPRWPRRSASRCATPTCSSWPRRSPTSARRDEEDGKIERGERESLTLELVRTVDVLASTRPPRPVPRRLRRGGRPAARPGPGQEGGQGRRPARLQRHPRRGRRHRLGRERDHHPHASTARCTCRARRRRPARPPSPTTSRQGLPR